MSGGIKEIKAGCAGTVIHDLQSLGCCRRWKNAPVMGGPSAGAVPALWAHLAGRTQAFWGNGPQELPLSSTGRLGTFPSKHPGPALAQLTGTTCWGPTGAGFGCDLINLL